MVSEQTANVVPIWTLSTKEVAAPVEFDESMSPERLTELRSVLAVLADAPITTLELHPAPESLDTSRAMAFSNASPIAQQLSTFASEAAKRTPKTAESADTVYRMVVPAKVASQVSGGVLNPMTSKAASGGVHSALVTANGKIGAQATFVPLAAGAGAGVMAVATPLVLLAVAAGASVHAEQQRKAAIEKITVLLEKLHQDHLDGERSRLEGCRNAIDKATAVLLDRGTIGAALGLDSAVNAIDTAIATAEMRVQGWRAALDQLPADKVELPDLIAAIEGIDADDSEFFAHLELADLAIALKRRVIVLQAVEHAQQDEAKTFENFTDALRLDSKNLSQLIADLDDVRTRLSSMQLDRSHGLRDFTFSSRSVDTLLQTSQRLRTLGDRVSRPLGRDDIAIEMVRKADGSVLILPPVAG